MFVFHEISIYIEISWISYYHAIVRYFHIFNIIFLCIKLIFNILFIIIVIKDTLLFEQPGGCGK